MTPTNKLNLAILKPPGVAPSRALKGQSNIKAKRKAAAFINGHFKAAECCQGVGGGRAVAPANKAKPASDSTLRSWASGRPGRLAWRRGASQGRKGRALIIQRRECGIGIVSGRSWSAG